MMGYRAASKKAIKDAIKAEQTGIPTGNADSRPGILNFWNRVQETSMFGSEAKVPGQNTVVGPDAYSDRRWYATLSVDANGKVIGIK